MSYRILHVWAAKEQQRRAVNRLMAACLVVLLAMVAGWAWGWL